MKATVGLGAAVLTLYLGTILLTRDSYKFYEFLGPIWALSIFVFELSCCSSHIVHFEIRILLLCSVFVAWTLFIFEYGLLAMQRYINLRHVFLDFMQLVAVDVILLLILMMMCYRSESFTREVKKTKKLSIFVMSQYTNGARCAPRAYLLEEDWLRKPHEGARTEEQSPWPESARREKEIFLTKNSLSSLLADGRD
ncbi:hypothetical protein MSG28_001710 [Choristoneura fumiferana]|uniref:Uncharacterized protein n=1 Tax=Choristoneura fumiferana TaxID=7141 RepID=A0ACC0KVQ2_CHOFU|nr:hypothetical protein MSG28_001710 [Choristoneura fumiferana]